MADGLHLADFGKAVDGGAHVLRAQGGRRVDRRDVEVRELVGVLARRAALEEQRFVLRGMGSDLGNHIQLKTSAIASMSARLDISVAHSNMESASSG